MFLPTPEALAHRQPAVACVHAGQPHHTVGLFRNLRHWHLDDLSTIRDALLHLIVNGVQDSTALFPSASKALNSQELHAPLSHALLVMGNGCLHKQNYDYGGIGTPAAERRDQLTYGQLLS